MKKFIPLSIPNFEGNEKKYVEDALEQGWVSTGGSYISKFEEKMAEFLHVNSIAACQSGTAALHLALIEAGVRPGDVVLVPPLTFIATVNPVKYQFATPVFIDCDDSLCMDPVKLREFCENECVVDNGNLKYKAAVVRAIIIVHVFGNLADMLSIIDIAEKYNLKVIEDATEALGSHYIKGRLAGKFAGTIGDYGAYSFNGNKIITTGGGGAVTAKRTEAVTHLKYLSTQAKNDSKYYIHNEIGYNYRMTNLQAALGVAQMEELPEFIRRKQNNYEKYKDCFKGFELATMMPFRENTFSNKWFYSLKINRNRINVPIRDIIKELEEKGIQTRAVWGLINEQVPYLNSTSYRIEKAPYYAERILNIPASTQITVQEIEYVVEQIKNVLGGLISGQR